MRLFADRGQAGEICLRTWRTLGGRGEGGAMSQSGFNKSFL